MAVRNERFMLMAELAKLPKDMVFSPRSPWNPQKMANISMPCAVPISKGHW